MSKIKYKMSFMFIKFIKYYNFLYKFYREYFINNYIKKNELKKRSFFNKKIFIFNKIDEQF